jgi:hypothetical protein
VPGVLRDVVRVCSLVISLDAVKPAPIAGGPSDIANGNLDAFAIAAVMGHAGERLRAAGHLLGFVRRARLDRYDIQEVVGSGYTDT